MEPPVSRDDVRRTFDAIAEHFAETRHHPWPEVREFVADVDRADRALDVGCGNGRHSDLLAGVASRTVGVDASRAVLGTARQRLGPVSEVALLQADAVGLPFLTDSFDVGLYVATIHHLPSRADRLASLEELARVLRPDARALVSTWSTAHERFDADADADTGFDTTIEWTLPSGECVDRFHHIYAPAEFRADLERSGLAERSFEVSSGNCYAVVAPKGNAHNDT